MQKQFLLKELGYRICMERKRRGYTQEKFALHANLDRSYYGSIERGERNITICTLCQIASKLDRDIAYFTHDMPDHDSSADYGSGEVGAAEDQRK